MAAQIQVLEEGDLFFFYRPRVGTAEVRTRQDVQRLFMVTAPFGRGAAESPAKGKSRARKRKTDAADKKIYRLFVVGKKTLPEIREGETSPEERNWALNLLTSSDPEDVRRELQAKAYTTETRGERQVAAARPVGEGKYQLLQHGGHTELAYVLELPERPGPAQEEFEIKDQASYIVSVKNPDVTVPGFPGGARKPRYPKRLKEHFGQRRWINVTDPALLDYENTQIALVGARAGDVEEELEITIDGEDETQQSAEIFRRLKIQQEQVPLAPLFEGEFPEAAETRETGHRGSPAGIARLFAGFAFPADKDELLDHARGHRDRIDNAGELIDLLDQLPETRYGSMADVEGALGEVP
jgi:hypothetical protein